MMESATGTPSFPAETPARGTDPARQQVLLRLADLLIRTDDLLELLQSDPGGPLQSIEPPLRRIRDAVDDAMSQLSH
jgi:hypothetical protein